MSVDPARLLQMLEPAVRPGAQGPASAGQAGKPAFESRSFEDLLADAGQADRGPADAAGQGHEQAKAANALAGLGRIENVALRGLLANSGKAGGGPAGNE